ncbi:MBL fold metallo-hydrolase [Brevibacillus borstelensis]|nr:MBL fold metallo-hydrolase [Brevibacillus borstelensis]MCM3624819.1 MBL fold metallo-hydrolase [Brevibacillus borstelensis]
MTVNTTTGVNKMSSKELAQMVFNKEELFILDVRNESDFNDWKIEGENIEIINVPYFDLIDGVDPALDKIPQNKKVLVVCAKEGSSLFVAEQIVEAGRTNVYYLEGGMKAWSEHLEPVKVGDLKDGGSIYQFVRIGKGCLSYMVVSNGEAAIVDTLRMTDVYEQFAKEMNVTIKHTIDTHLHADHISGGKKLAEKVGATYWLPPKDATEVTFTYEKLEEGKDITVGNTTIHIQPIYSPGHTIGSTSLIVDNQYFLTGDILFIESIGRPDLAGKAEDWVGDLRNTLYKRYKELSNDLIVLPAHFGKVSELGEGGKVSARMGDLYQKNPGLNIQDEVEFRKTVTENLPPQPNAYQEIRQTNMGKITPTEEEQREMEIGPNRCAVHDK